MPFYHHYQCSFKLSFCHLEILKKILIFSKISHWISIFSIITIYSYHKRIPDGLKIVPYLFWVISPILNSVNCIPPSFLSDCNFRLWRLRSSIFQASADFFHCVCWIALGMENYFLDVKVGKKKWNIIFLPYSWEISFSMQLLSSV